MIKIHEDSWKIVTWNFTEMQKEQKLLFEAHRMQMQIQGIKFLEIAKKITDT